ncbi:MAG: hypothetical protein AVDCRST_MAG50-3265, partial [uncultured Acidimicrobiales bacterium]
GPGPNRNRCCGGVLPTRVRLDLPAPRTRGRLGQRGRRSVSRSRGDHRRVRRRRPVLRDRRQRRDPAAHRRCPPRRGRRSHRPLPRYRQRIHRRVVRRLRLRRRIPGRDQVVQRRDQL